MDQKHSDERPGSDSFGIPALLVMLAFLLKSASWIINTIVGDDPGPAGSGGTVSHITENLHNVASDTMIDTFCILMVVVAGVLYATGIGGSGRSDEPLAEAPRTRRTPTLLLNETARAAEARLAELIAQFRSIPEHIVLQEASIEFERIEAKHVPDLQLAHREARTTVSATSAKADLLDADYAVMLNRLNDSLQRLIESCEALGRERLEVQGRFIEARHPTDTHQSVP